MKRLRKGLYEYRGHLIELLNEWAEVYPTQLDYNQWAVCKIGKESNRWLITFATLKQAIYAIDYRKDLSND